MNKQEMSELIESKCEKLFSTSREFVVPAGTEEGKNYLGRNREIERLQPHRFQYVYDHYKNVLGWIPANPSRKGLGEAIESVFVFADHSISVPSNFFNTKVGHAAIITHIITRDKFDPIFILGAKGTGKTFYQNFLFNTETQRLYNEGIVWYRAECSKLYRENAATKSKCTKREYRERRLTLEDYLNAHIVFVTFKYRHNNEVFNDIWEDKGGMLTELIINKWYIDFDKTSGSDIEPDMLLKCFKDFAEKAKLEEKSLQSFLDLHKDRILRLLNPDLRQRCLLMADAIIKFLVKRDFVPLFVIDGLDNCDYYDQHDEYMNLLEEVKQFALKDDKEKEYKRKIIISCRVETFDHLQKKNIVFFRKGTNIKFLAKPLDVKTLVKKKVDEAIAPSGTYFHESLGDANLKIDTFLTMMGHKKTDRTAIVREANSRFNEFTSMFPTNLIDSLNMVTRDFSPPLKLNEKTLVEMVYNRNYRSVLSNFLNVFQYWRLFHFEKSSITADREYVYREGQLLNGSLYYDSATSDFELGKCIPNIFHFRTKPLMDKWHGMCLYRILQLLISKEMTEVQASKKIHEQFSYDMDVVRERMRAALSHGLVKSNLHMNRVTYKTSQKGKFLLKYVFADVSVFYFLALDTPLCNSAIERTNMVRYHSNGDRLWEFYTEGCILTAITLIRHIVTTSRSELERKKSTSIDIYRLPKHFPYLLIEGMIAQLVRLQEFSREDRFRRLIHDIEGIV